MHTVNEKARPYPSVNDNDSLVVFYICLDAAKEQQHSERGNWRYLVHIRDVREILHDKMSLAIYHIAKQVL